MILARLKRWRSAFDPKTTVQRYLYESFTKTTVQPSSRSRARHLGRWILLQTFFQRPPRTPISKANENSFRVGSVLFILNKNFCCKQFITKIVLYKFYSSKKKGAVRNYQKTNGSQHVCVMYVAYIPQITWITADYKGDRLPLLGISQMPWYPTQLQTHQKLV